jgi:hypothetical protein
MGNIDRVLIFAAGVPTCDRHATTATKARAILAGALAAAMTLLTSCASNPSALADKYARFRAENQAAHDAAGAAFAHRYLQVGTVRWHFVEAGDPKGPTVLLLHGLPESWFSWVKVLPLLDPAFQYIVPDMKGYGQSTASDTDYNWHTVARQTLDLVDA